MSALIDILPAHRFDQERLRAYLCDVLPELKAFGIRQFQGGQSNPTFLIEGANARYVLRKKPPGVLLPSAHQIEREYRIIRALHGTDVPVPRPVLLCEDATIIGTAFYVMEFVPGRLFDRPELDTVRVDERAGIYDAMNATIAALHRVDWARLGLSDFGKPQNYLQRQVERWSKQYAASIVEAPDPLVEQVIAWLRVNMPNDSAITIAHGDFRLGNLIFDDASARVAAVLDWELSTLGDPLSDLAYCCMPYHLPTGVPGVPGLQGVDLKTLGIPSQAEFLDRYCQRTGLSSVSHWPFYVAFSLFRLTAILQGVYARAVQGNASNANALQAGERARVFARAAHAVASEEARVA